ncbi:sensor histidine kinase [Sporanaerobium hydrogeniformans]|uniref:Sensor histidine kinase n=1 Tax=Sporanaerobium hydrogeniformans TaxID=3072179 RepID=A0AC61D966_9FIRM|nr:ATP-binding protein [Sporanaerobium hydrogeniformans]PHV69268.1 sensor histidine kinase [Sporanaerobium hydrogeniformans]
MIKKLKNRFILITMSLLTCILVALLTSICLLMYNGGKEQSLRTLQDIAQRDGIPEKLKPPTMFPVKKPLSLATPPQFPMGNPNRHNSFSVKCDDSNQMISLQLNLWDAEEVDQQKLQLLVTKVHDSPKTTGIIQLEGLELRFLKQTKPYGSIIVFLDRSLEIATFNRLVLSCLIIGILTLGIFFIISYYLSLWAIRPMADAWEKQKQFVADASHELRTPLTIISANIDAVLNQPLDTVDRQSKWLKYIQFETRRMNKLVNNLLELAKLDSLDSKENATSFNLSDVMMNVCLPFESLIFEGGKTFNLSIEENIYCFANEDKLRQLAIILLDNAIKNAIVGGSIDVSLKKHKEKIYLTVTNTGPGIPPEHLPHIFERFYRADMSRVHESGGYGLGLSIAKAIVLQHGGTIEAKSSLEGPTSFEITLPTKLGRPPR